MDDEKKTFRPGHALIHILPEVSTEKYKREDVQLLIDECQSIMQTEYTKLSKEGQALSSKKQA